MHDPCPNAKLYDAGKCCGGTCFDEAANLLSALRAQGAYVGDDSDLRCVVVDGHLDLVALVAAIRSQSQPERTTE